MKQAVAHLIPYIEAEKTAAEAAKIRAKGKVVIATVKGDVHDIGKNIVSVVLQCNNFDVVNMGVMVPCDEDSRDGEDEKARHDRLVRPDHSDPGRNGATLRREMQRDGYSAKQMPLLIGGATTSRVHTAVKIAPHYRRPGGLCAGRVARSVRRLPEPAVGRRRREVHRRTSRPTTSASEPSMRTRKRPSGRTGRMRERTQTRVDWTGEVGQYMPPRPKFHRPPRVQELRPGDDCQVRRLGSVLPDVGPARAVSADPCR